jgi:hypothetical protein
MGVKIQLFEVEVLEEVPLAKRIRMVFQHDGAPAHYSRHHLNLKFPLWGWMKSEVYKENKHKRRIGRSHYE